MSLVEYRVYHRIDLACQAWELTTILPDGTKTVELVDQWELLPAEVKRCFEEYWRD